MEGINLGIVNQHNNEKGVTLLEILVSIIILGLILMIFFGVFIQSSRINNTSENVIGATYVAQTEMESIYSFSLNTPYDLRDSMMIEEDLGYSLITGDTGCDVVDCKAYGKYDSENHLYIKVRLKPFEDMTNTDSVIVEVYEGNTFDEDLQAKMEKVIVWGVGLS